MENKGKCIQLIDGHGTFNFDPVTNFLKAVNFGKHGNTYRVVSIIGPQSSGKSTLLNHLFRTNFVELDALQGRHQTTKGIWLGTFANDIDPFTLVMDLEGTDGRERGENDTTFEKWSALFALIVSDIVIMNMKYSSVGLENAANKPLMRVVVQAMMRLSKRHKIMLLFVIRDNEETPLEKLKEILIDDMKQIWDSVKKPQNLEDTKLNHIFNMEFVALTHYKFNKDQFKKEVEDLKQNFFRSSALEGLIGNRQRLVGASLFVDNAKQIWEDIKAYKILSLPAYRKMAATTHCEDIFKETLSDLLVDKSWGELKTEANSGPVHRFGKRLRIILDDYLARYDEKVAGFDEEVSSAKRQQLESSALNDAFCAYQCVLDHLSSGSLQNFTDRLKESLQSGEGFVVAAEKHWSQCLSEFNEGYKDACVERASGDPSSISWDPSKVAAKLRCDINKHMLAQLADQYEKQLSAALEEPVGLLLHDGSYDTWSKVRELLARETTEKRDHLSRDLSDLKIDEETTGTMLESLAAFGRSVVEKRARDEAKKVVSHMKDKFLSLFNPARKWTRQDDIQTIAKAAYSGPLKLLSVMAALRLDDKPSNMDMERSISLALTDAGDSSFTSGTLTSSVDLLASNIWEGVAAANVLIKPVDCKHLWERLVEEVQPSVDQAYAAHENAEQLVAKGAEAEESKRALNRWKTRAIFATVLVTGVVTGGVAGVAMGAGIAATAGAAAFGGAGAAGVAAAARIVGETGVAIVGEFLREQTSKYEKLNSEVQP